MKASRYPTTVLSILFATTGLSGCGLSLGQSSTASVSSGTVMSQTNSVSGTSTTTVTKNATLTLTLSSNSVLPSSQVEMTASGGSGTYTYTIYQGSGTISGTLYVAPSTTGTATLEVRDSDGNTAYSQVVITDTPNATATSTSTISLSGQEMYTSASVTLAATGGDGVYQYYIQSGSGTLTGTTFLAPSYPETVVIEVVDNAGNTATASFYVTSSTYLTSGAYFVTDSDALITFDMPTDTADYAPSFVVGGAGANKVFGYNYNEMTETTYFAPGPSSAGVALTNFDLNDTSPYTGTLNLLDRSGNSMAMNFCILPGSTTAYLQEPSGLTAQIYTNSVSFGQYAGGQSAGTNIQGIWFRNVDPASGVGSVDFWVSEGRNNHALTDCSTYSWSTMSAASTF